MKTVGSLIIWMLTVQIAYSADAAPVDSSSTPPAEPAVQKYRRSRLTRDETEGLADRRRLRIGKGEDRTVDLDFEPEMSTDRGLIVGNKALVDVRAVKVGEKRQLVFSGKDVGETTVNVRDTDGNVRLIFSVTVAASNLERRAAELRGLLREIDGIDIKVVGQKIVIDGELIIPQDWGRLTAVIQDKQFSEFVLNLVTWSPLGLQVIAKRIEEHVKTFAPNITTRVVNGVIFLEGTADTDEVAKKAFELGKVYLPESRPPSQMSKDPNAPTVDRRELLQSLIVVTPAPPKRDEKLIRVTFYFVELSKNYIKNFGFKWQPGFTASPQIAIGQQAGAAGANGAVAAQGPTFSATISSLFPRLNSSNSAGYARVLKTSTIVTRSGKPAELNEQTEIPYALGSGGNGMTQAQMAKVGLAVGVTPTILGKSEDIEMTVDLNQVNLTDRAPGSAPSTSNHKVKTTLFVKNGESAAVAGVNSGDVRTDFNGDDPRSGSFSQGTEPLFTLLRSKRYEKKKSQFVIFVSPQIIESASEGTEDLQKNFRVKIK